MLLILFNQGLSFLSMVEFFEIVLQIIFYSFHSKANKKVNNLI